MNLALSEEQEALREAARGALGRAGTLAAARATLDGAEPPDLWPLATAAGWPGLLVGEERGGAGLDAFDAMLVAQECGRMLARVPLLGALPASALLDAAGDGTLEAVAGGETRPTWLPVRPPCDRLATWTVEPSIGLRRGPAPRAEVDGDRVAFTGTVPAVPDASGAALLVVVGVDGDGALVAGVVEAGDAAVSPIPTYDPARSLATVTLDGVAGRRLALHEDDVARAWYLAQALVAAESLGAVEAILATAVAYAQQRFAFGRAIGSYQAIKHGLTEVLRRQENAHSLLLYAGWSFQARHDELARAASAARAAAGDALDFAARQSIVTHGGIGVTWEHDAPLYFRRAQQSRRLLGGTGDALDRVAGELLAAH